MLNINVPNTDTLRVINELTADKDIFGQTLSVGDRVRSYDFPFLFSNGVIEGFSDKGNRVSYVEGILTAVGETKVRGCERYTIKIETRVFGSEIVSFTEGEVFPPLNGTRSIGGTNPKTFGVAKI